MPIIVVRITPILDWWKEQHAPHQHLGCVCNTGGWCGSYESLARRVQVSHSTIFRRIRYGRLTVDEADDWAIRVGVHPSAIWTDWDRLQTCQGRFCDQ